MADQDGFRADWAQKDFYQVLGVKKDATADEIKKAYRKLARANHPDSNPGDAAKHDKFKAIAEAYDVVGDADKRKKYDEMRSLYGSGGGFRGGGGERGFNLDDLLRERSGWRRLRRHVRRPVRRRPARQQARRPVKGPDVGDLGHDQLHRRHRRRHGVAAADLRRRLPRLPGHRRQAGHQAAHLPRVRGRGVRGLVGGRRVLDERDLPDVRRPAAGLRRAVPDLRRQRPGHVGADDPGPDPRPGSRTVRRSGCAARAAPATTAAPPATSTSRCASLRTGSSGARATT